MSLTRGQTCHYFIGQPSELPRNVLPRECDIFNYFRLLQGQLPKSTPVNEISDIIAKEIVQLWNEKGNLPTLSLVTVTDKVKELHTRGRNVLKTPRKRRKSTVHEPLEGVRASGRPSKKDNFEGLFDICSCHCKSRNSFKCQLHSMDQWGKPLPVQIFILKKL